MDKSIDGSEESTDPGQAGVELLQAELKKWGSAPTPSLEALFATAARIPMRSHPGLISTERLLLAVRDITSAAAEHEVSATSEGAALFAAAKILNSRWELILAQGGMATDYPARPSVRGLTENVRACLRQALEGILPPKPRDINLADFLYRFPPASSIAGRVLQSAGVSLEHLWDSVARASTAVADASGTESREGTAGGDEAAQEASTVQSTSESERKTSQGGTPQTDTDPSSASAFNDTVTTHADEPALIDQLERAPFASCLAQNIREARTSGETGASAFIVHLHGPWGSGKSSVLNFLEAELRKEPDPWLVVRFNAWRDQRRQPPWWSLITCIYAGARRNPDRNTSKRLWWRWFKWRVRADYMPWAVAAALIALCVALVTLGLTTSVGPAVTTIGGAITLLGAGAVAVRSLALGSQRAAQTYAELKADPFQPITDLFESLITSVGCPVAVFIDDLDRCDSNYVVELLEGVQTLMRTAPVTYVVAADRKWICSSFEQKYAKFSPPIGEAGRPLGYLFLDKIFQISAGVPQLAGDIRRSYWDSLLSLSKASSASETRETADQRAKADLARMTTHEQLQRAVEKAEASNDPVLIQAIRAQAAMRITSAEASADAEHRLKAYADLIEPNPRSMKRLINSYGMHQATLFLAGRTVSPDALARWTILELRWPLLADFLAARPNYVDRLSSPLDEANLRRVPERLVELFGDELVIEVVGSPDTKHRLNADAVRSILGAVQSDR